MQKEESIVIVASYGGPYGGNFIPSLIEYDRIVKKQGYRTIYIFPEFIKESAWVETMEQIADGIYFIPYKAYSFDNVHRIRKICKNENAVLIYSRMTGWDITARFAMPFLPLIWHFEMGHNLSSVKDKIKYWIKYNILGFGKTYHIAVSENATQVINSLNVKHKCEWIPNAINTNRLVEKETCVFQNPIRLLTFAYAPIIKGFDLALDACEELNKDKTNYILMASAQQPTYDYIDERYGANPPKWLELIEPTDKISDLFNRADILLSVSRSEGLSFANLEGIYSGLPVVYSKIPGNKLLGDFEMTYGFESENVNELIKAIEQCVAKPISNKSREKNRKIINDNYSMNAWSEKIGDFLIKTM